MDIPPPFFSFLPLPIEAGSNRVEEQRFATHAWKDSKFERFLAQPRKAELDLK